MAKPQHFLDASLPALIIVGAFLSFTASAADNNDFDVSYNIKMVDSKCGNLGYVFKLQHERDGLSSKSAMFKSNKVSAGDQILVLET